MTSVAPPPASSESTALLAATAARIAVDDVVAIDRMTVTTAGERVLILGDAAPLMGALTGVALQARTPPLATTPDPSARSKPREAGGECRVVGGKLFVVGADVAEADHLVARSDRPSIVGAAPLDPPMPLDWTASEYVVWSARLAGHPKRIATEIAAAALERVGLARMRATQLRMLDVPSRRALVLAHAAVAFPRVIVADAPLQGLSGAAATFVLRALAAVTEGRGAILAQTRVDPGTLEGSLARGATDVLVFSGGELVIDVPAADLLAAARLFAVTVRTNAEILRIELLSRGIDLRGGPIRFAATLPPGLGAKDILAAAATVKAAVVDVYPLLT